MYISERYRSVFVAIPRTASRAVAAWFMFTYGARQYGHHHCRHLPVEAPPHAVDFEWWTVVRDPWSRAASLYRLYSTEPMARCGWGPESRRQDLRTRFEKQSFEEFTDWLAHQRSGELTQCQIIDSCVTSPAVCHFEHLASALEMLPFAQAPVTVPRIKPVDTSHPLDDPELWTGGDRINVARWAKDDLDRWPEMVNLQPSIGDAI